MLSQGGIPNDDLVKVFKTDQAADGAQDSTVDDLRILFRNHHLILFHFSVRPVEILAMRERAEYPLILFFLDQEK
ncbi:hypothetical protein YC2023_097742 [Brassica napus]